MKIEDWDIDGELVCEKDNSLFLMAWPNYSLVLLSRVLVWYASVFPLGVRCFGLTGLEN